jgi:hypothetical protein
VNRDRPDPKDHKGLQVNRDLLDRQVLLVLQDRQVLLDQLAKRGVLREDTNLTYYSTDTRLFLLF